MAKINELFDIITINNNGWTFPMLNNEQENYIKQSKHISFFHPNQYNELNNISNYIKVICSHTGDYINQPNDLIDNFMTNNPQIKFYITNINISKKTNIECIPLGILDYQADIIGNMDYDIDKYNFVYCNFNCHTYSDRARIWNIIKNKQFITQKNYLPSMGVKNFHLYCDDLTTYKFAIVPRGNGMDTYRMWECLYFGVVPIVEKSNFTSYFKELPILEIESYEFLTEQFLNQQYDIIKNKTYNMNYLNRSFWINQIYEILSK